MIKKIFCITCCILLLGGCHAEDSEKAGSDKEDKRMIIAMETTMDLAVYGGEEAVLDEMEERIRELDKKLSVTDGKSQIAELNRNGSAKVSADVYGLVEKALKFSEATDGAFDISIYPLVKAWGFTLDNPHVPERSEIEAAKAVVNYRNVKLKDCEIALDPGMQIDLGGIAKGYLGDELIKILKKHKIKSALLNLGGNVVAHGSRPDGTDWRVALTDPNGDEYAGIIAARDKSIITSGGYERFFKDENGKVYWHIMDSRTGYPADNGLISATIVGKSGVQGDAMSTALFVMGTERAIEFCKAQNDFDVILITKDMEFYITEGLKENFNLTDKYAEKTVHII